MGLDHPPLVFRQPVGLVENLDRNLGFADVVQQGGQPQRQVGRRTWLTLPLQLDRLVQHDEAVFIDVFVVMVFVDLQAQRR